jgi:glycosyltransferase involved in cell wall biosynthesis
MLKRPGTIVIVPPWPRSGSANLFEAQCDFFAKTGREVALLVAPCNYNHHSYDFWLLDSVKTGFAFESVTHLSWASLGKDIRLAKIKGRFRWLLAGRDSNLNIQARLAQDTFFSPKFLDFVATHDISEIFTNHVFNMLLAEKVAKMLSQKTGKRPKIYLESHDIQSFLYASRINEFSKMNDLSDDLIHNELDLMSRADHVTHCSETDLTFFSNELPNLKHSLLPPTISEKNEILLVNCRHSIKQKTIDFLWIGNNNPGNVKSLIWFIDLVLPFFDLTKTRIYFVGTIRDYFKWNDPITWAKYNQLFCGEVDDIITYYEAARVLIVPVTFGTGVSIKFVEALCTGKPVVASARAFRGLSSKIIEQLPIRGVDVPTEFFNAMMEALESCDQTRHGCSKVFDKELSSKRYRERLSEITGLPF